MIGGGANSVPVRAPEDRRPGTRGRTADQKSPRMEIADAA